MAVISQLMNNAAAIFGDDEEQKPEDSEAAKEAVSDEMGQAMMAYLPLRGMISFSQGRINHEILKGLLDQMNNA